MNAVILKTVILVAGWLACLCGLGSGGEPQVHRLDRDGGYLPAGWPDQPPRLIAVAGRSLRIELGGSPADLHPDVRLSRITDRRSVPVSAGVPVRTAEGWQWSWTPPKTSGTVHYEVSFVGEPGRVVRIECRDAEWMKSTLEMLRDQCDWRAEGLRPEERAALAGHGLRPGPPSSSAGKDRAVLVMSSRQGTSRRTVTWDAGEPALVVWRPGPAAGDLEVRAPRWWISPEALATDQGLIRLLDLFSEAPLNP